MKDSRSLAFSSLTVAKVLLLPRLPFMYWDIPLSEALVCYYRAVCGRHRTYLLGTPRCTSTARPWWSGNFDAQPKATPETEAEGCGKENIYRFAREQSGSSSRFDGHEASGCTHCPGSGVWMAWPILPRISIWAPSESSVRLFQMRIW